MTTRHTEFLFHIELMNFPSQMPFSYFHPPAIANSTLINLFLLYLETDIIFAYMSPTIESTVVKSFFVWGTANFRKQEYKMSFSRPLAKQRCIKVRMTLLSVVVGMYFFVFNIWLQVCWSNFCKTISWRNCCERVSQECCFEVGAIWESPRGYPLPS